MQDSLIKIIFIIACVLGLNLAQEGDKAVDGCGCPARIVCYGPQGPRGHRGPNGPRGPAGLQGEKGPAGADGTFPGPQNAIHLWSLLPTNNVATPAALTFQNYTMTAGFTPTFDSITFLNDGIYVVYVYLVTDDCYLKATLDGDEVVGSESEFNPYAADQFYVQFVVTAQANQVLQLLFQGSIYGNDVGADTVKASVFIQQVGTTVI